MAKILCVLTGASYWTLKDGHRHPTGYWAEEFVRPYTVFTDAGHEVTVATPRGLDSDFPGFQKTRKGKKKYAISAYWNLNELRLPGCRPPSAGDRRVSAGSEGCGSRWFQRRGPRRHRSPRGRCPAGTGGPSSG